MGISLSCCCGDSSDLATEPTETSRLLTDPVASTGSEQRIPSDVITESYPSSVPKKSDEQSIMLENRDEITGSYPSSVPKKSDEQSIMLENRDEITGSYPSSVPKKSDEQSVIWENCDEITGSYPSSVPKKSDEQSVMTKILNETALNVIDVAALGPHAIEQNEYLERKNFYKIKVGPHLNLPWLHARAYHKCILFDIPDPERVLGSHPISIYDYNLMEKATMDMSIAMEGLAVDHKEDLIVPFQIP